MKNLTTDEEISEEISDAFKAIAVNSLLNCYALENVALGLNNPNQKVPFEQYMSDLQIGTLSPYMRKEFANGIYIDENHKIVDRNKDELTLEFYSSCINILFDKIMRRKYAKENNYDLPCCEYYRDYFIESYPLFKNILDTEIEYDEYDIIPDNLDLHEQNIRIAKMTKFVVAILLNGLRRRKCVDRYLKDIDVLPFAVKNLIEKVNNRYILAKHTESIEYKIALFYLFPYLTETHRKFFELKAKRWYELNVESKNNITEKSEQKDLWIAELKMFPHTHFGIWTKYHFSKPIDTFYNRVGKHYHLVRMKKDKFYAVGFVENQFIYFIPQKRSYINSENIKLIRQITEEELAEFDSLIEKYKKCKPDYSDMENYMSIDDEIEIFVIGES